MSGQRIRLFLIVEHQPSPHLESLKGQGQIEQFIISAADPLSQRGCEVLRLLARRLTNADIAERLHLSEETVRNYVSAVLAEMDVSDRTQAAVIALRYGLVDLSEI